MGQQQVKYARFTGEKKPGETQSLRNVLIPDGEDLLSSFQGFKTIKDIFE